MQHLPFVIFSALLSFSAAAETENEIEFYTRLATSVVKVEAHNTNGRLSIGSGVVISDDAIATNCHVTRGAGSLEVIKGGLRAKVESQISDLEHDVCILQVTGFKAPIATTGSSKAQVGQRVVALGYVGGVGPRLSVGNVTALFEHQGGRVIESTAAFTSGASGGGLFDEQGKLLGLVTFLRHNQEEGQHYSVPLDWIYQVLAKKQAAPVEPIKDGAPFWQQTAANQPFFLRAVTQQTNRQFESMRSITQAWTAADNTNADAWFMLGNAHFNLGDDEKAIGAFRIAISHDLDHRGAWYALGVAYNRAGQPSETESVFLVLKGLDEHLAVKFAKDNLSPCNSTKDIVTC